MVPLVSTDAIYPLGGDNSALLRYLGCGYDEGRVGGASFWNSFSTVTVSNKHLGSPPSMDNLVH